ncbi:metallophosphoesterase family protein [Jiangella anatolica]|uniref:Phosphoesterase n=1 Tax=Jiangella anatolica TaxID=2670374 RepID=A0A2W2AXB8_9ACTN|nr:metallophosphoesterase family protein [Jiangella anatolica]PZF79811.1 metallophosphoesterase [Jiangella anatolica]
MADVTRVAVLSDTHAPRFWKSCPPAVADHLDGADLILHAGDVCVPSVLDELTAFAPVHAVLGNNDGADVAAWGAGVADELRLTVAGVRIAMLHDSGPASGRLPRLRARFPDTDLVVFGHSHIPWNEESGGFRVFNPGSPTDKRRQPHGTMGLLTLNDGRVTSAEIVAVTP